MNPESQEPIDWPRALDAMQGDASLLAIAVQAAIEEVPSLLDRVRRAVAEGNPDELRLAAHTLKGSVQYFVVERLVEMLLELESLGKAGDVRRAGERLADLEREVGLFYAALRRYSDSPPK